MENQSGRTLHSLVEWKHFNVHWKYEDRGGKVCVTALSKEDAKQGFILVARSAQLPNGAVITKVIGPLGVHQATAKQIAAHHYRSCIGAATMVHKALNSVVFSPLPTNSKVAIAHALAISQATKLQRDIRDLFRKAGLNIK